MKARVAPIAGWSAVACLLVIASFQAGREMVVVFGQGKDASITPSDRSSSHVRSTAETVDFQKILIGNIATIGFEQLYDLLQAASPEVRADWGKQLDAMPWSAQRTAALTSFYKTYVQLDPAAAAASVDSLSDIDTKIIATDSMVGAAPESAMGQIAKMLITLPREYVNTSPRDYLVDVFEEWSAVDPQAAARFIDEHPADKLEDYQGTLVYAWACVDPNSARIWLERQPVPEGTSGSFDSLFNGWFEKDRLGAQNYLIAHADEAKLKDAIGNVARGSFLASPGEGRAFVSRLPNDELKQKAMNEIASITREPTYTWSTEWERPPALVANWMLDFPKEVWGEPICLVIENWWREKDPAEVNAWVEQLPVATRDTVAANLCRNSNLEDEAFLVPLAMRIADAGTRDQSLRRFLERWLPFNREFALEAIQKTELPANQKAYLLKIFAKGIKNKEE